MRYEEAAAGRVLLTNASRSAGRRILFYSNEGKAHMCLSTAYVYDGKEQKEIMKDVARIEAEQGGFWLIDFFGKKLFVEATIQTVDLVEGHFVALKSVKLPIAGS